jgi:hypothetical protein
MRLLWPARARHRPLREEHDTADTLDLKEAKGRRSIGCTPDS